MVTNHVLYLLSYTQIFSFCFAVVVKQRPSILCEKHKVQELLYLQEIRMTHMYDATQQYANHDMKRNMSINIDIVPFAIDIFPNRDIGVLNQVLILVLL